jgi:hypothetical protein
LPDAAGSRKGGLGQDDQCVRDCWVITKPASSYEVLRATRYLWKLQLAILSSKLDAKGERRGGERGRANLFISMYNVENYPGATGSIP